MNNPIPEKYRDMAAYGAIFLAVVIFFADALFTGKNFLSEGDNVAFYSFIPYLKAAKAAGEFPLWMPHIFSGMPSLASFLAAGERTWDVFSMLLFAFPRMLGDLFGNDTARLGMWYTIYGWGVYTLMRVKNHSRLVGIFSGTSAIFATFVITWIMIGHSTKPVSLATLPWILLALERLREKFSLLNVFLLTLAMIALVSATHPQMMFYMGCAAGIYLIVELTTRLISKNGYTNVLKAGGALVLATIIALGTHADMFLATREYTPLSTRGSAPLVQVEGKQQQDQTGGNDYEYATNWSFSPGEIMTFMVPNYYGFGNTKVKGSGGREQRTNLYWGQMPFTDAANYMGIGVLLLGILGAWFNRRDPFVIFLIALSLFSLLLSFGKNFPILYDLVYYNAPAFNKFRAPSMALALLQFAMPVLAGYGLTTLMGWHNAADRKKTGTAILGVTAAFLVIGFAYTSINESSYKEQVATALAEKNPQQVRSAADISPQYLTMVYDEMKSDWITIGFFAVGFGLIAFLTIRGSLKPTVAVSLAIALSLIDLWRVDARPYEPRKGSPEQNVFRKTDAVDFLQRDKSAYRIVDLSRGLPANWWAYHFIENVHGYSSAKIRVYQDMLDVAGPGPGREPVPGNSMIVNPFVWNLLNVKYIVSDQPVFQGVQPAFQSSTGLLVYENAQALPRAWFVDTVKVESDRRKTLEMLRDGTFDPRTTAYVEADVNKIIAPDSTATVRVTGKSNQKLTLQTTTAADAFLVVSEVYYPEWHCTIDGKPVETSKTNFLLRGVVVPAGTHTVEFSFSSPAFEQGRTISIASNMAALLIGLAGLAAWFRRRKAASA